MNRIRKHVRSLVRPFTREDAAHLLFAGMVIGLAAFFGGPHASVQMEWLHRMTLVEHDALLMGGALSALILGLIAMLALLVGWGHSWQEYRRRRGCATRVRREMSRRGLPSIPLHDGALYPRRPSPTGTVWFGSRKTHRRRAYEDAWYWDVAEYVLIWLVGAALVPTLLMCGGATGGLPEPDILDPIALCATWWTVAGTWWRVVMLGGTLPTIVYGSHRLREWTMRRQRRSYRARRRSALTRASCGPAAL